MVVLFFHRVNVTLFWCMVVLFFHCVNVKLFQCMVVLFFPLCYGEIVLAYGCIVFFIVLKRSCIGIL